MSGQRELPPEMLPWEIDEFEIKERKGVPDAEARNFVIMQWLRKGDTRPFYDWVLCGHRPSREIIEAVAHMMMRADSPGYDPANTDNPDLAASLPYGLAVNYGSAGRPPNPEKEVLKHLAGRYSSNRMDAGVKGESADYDTLDFLKDSGVDISKGDFKIAKGTVEAARKEYRRSRQGKKTP